jgi:hypothetical protein
MMTVRAKELVAEWHAITFPKDRTYGHYASWCRALGISPAPFQMWLLEVLSKPEPWLLKFASPDIPARLQALEDIGREFADAI